MKKPIALTAEDARRILALEKGQWELDLSCGTQTVRVDNSIVTIGQHRLERSQLQVAKSPKALYAVWDGGLERLQLFRGRLYKLAPTPGFPALEIDGIRMHRTKGISPEAEAEIKAQCLQLGPGQIVLDICTGLGYTSQAAARRGAVVVTLERDGVVLELARRNPWSFDFFQFASQGRIHPIVCDAARFVQVLPTSFFDRIMHDPPTFSMAGELYSLGFYAELRRITKEDGLVLHYTGQPGSRHRRLDLRRSVCRRLREAGFKTKWVEAARSVLAIPIPQAQQGT